MPFLGFKSLHAVVLLVFLVATTLSGCAVKKDFYASGGSRADGTIDMAYDFAQFEKPVVDKAQAQNIAKSKCRVWGYTDAEAFGSRAIQCHQFNGYGTCIGGQVIYKYQCIGSLNESNQPQLPAAVTNSGGMTKAQWQQHQLQKLMNDTSLDYDEYTKRYNEIISK